MDDAAAEFIRIQTALTGRYSLRTELGRGGMGVVYLAQDVALERPVAIKVLQPHLASQPPLRQRFLNEARTAAKLSHPNIIPIFAVDDVDDIVFFVMAYVDGETLGQRIRSRGPLPEAELAKTLREVGWALAYAHAQGVVHRDVKPDNIMIDRASGRAILVDFGIAHVVETTGAEHTGEILGTAAYMSPEQGRGERVDHRSDIYALGVVAHYGLAGRLPSDSAGVALPSQLGSAVQRCLADDPAGRFANAEEFADALGVVLAARHEAPLAVQSFIKNTSEITQNLLWISSFQLFFLLAAGLDSLTAQAAFRDVWLVFLGISVAAEPILGAGMLARIRGILKSGYTREDLVAAWGREIQLQAPERALEHGRAPGLIERCARWAVPFGAACAVGSAMMGGALTSATALGLGIVGLGATMLGGAVSLWHYDGRTALSRRITRGLLKSRLGRWAFGISGLGLDRPALGALAAHRPTELGIGMAIDGLFDGLPRATREHLAELPVIVRRLEEDAATMRQRIQQLNDAAEQLGAGQDAVERDLITARDSAAARLADTVVALETIRLDLLRLTAGEASVDNLTVDLSDARAVTEQVSRLLGARDALEAQLVRRIVPTPT